jgi:hypothetical protein
VILFDEKGSISFGDSMSEVIESLEKEMRYLPSWWDCIVTTC